jgi:cellobiose-specific phosphotransferase system component IIC
MTPIYIFLTGAIIVYFLSAIMSINICKEAVKQIEDDDGSESIPTRIAANYAPFIPVINTIICLVGAYIFVRRALLTLVFEVKLFIYKSLMRISKGAKKVRIGRLIMDKFYE